MPDYRTHPAFSCTDALLVGNDNLAIVDSLDDVVGGAAVDGAADGLGGTKDLLDTTGKVLGHGLVGHLAGNVVDLVEGNVASVLDVLLLLAVTDGLLERLDDERRSRGYDRGGGLTVLDGELDGHTETLPVASRLGNVFSDLLGGLGLDLIPCSVTHETKRTDLGGKRRRSTNLTTGGTEVDDLLESTRIRNRTKDESFEQAEGGISSSCAARSAGSSARVERERSSPIEENNVSTTPDVHHPSSRVKSAMSTLPARREHSRTRSFDARAPAARTFTSDGSNLGGMLVFFGV